MDIRPQRSDYFGALVWVTRLMSCVQPNQLDAPTPCEEFTVRALMGHLLGTAHRSAGTAEGMSARHIPHVITDVADTELAATYKSLTEDILKLWQPDADGDAPTTRLAHLLGHRRC